MANLLALLVDSVCIFFAAFSVLAVLGLLLTIGFYAGAALGPLWWMFVTVLLVAAVVGWGFLETTRQTDNARDWWAPRG